MPEVFSFVWNIRMIFNNMIKYYIFSFSLAISTRCLVTLTNYSVSRHNLFYHPQSKNQYKLHIHTERVFFPWSTDVLIIFFFKLSASLSCGSDTNLYMKNKMKILELKFFLAFVEFQQKVLQFKFLWHYSAKLI